MRFFLMFPPEWASAHIEEKKDVVEGEAQIKERVPRQAVTNHLAAA